VLLLTVAVAAGAWQQLAAGTLLLCVSDTCLRSWALGYEPSARINAPCLTTAPCV
jgi:hypothetical protein